MTEGNSIQFCTKGGGKTSRHQEEFYKAPIKKDAEGEFSASTPGISPWRRRACADWRNPDLDRGQSRGRRALHLYRAGSDGNPHGAPLAAALVSGRTAVFTDPLVVAPGERADLWW